MGISMIALDAWLPPESRRHRAYFGVEYMVFEESSSLSAICSLDFLACYEDYSTRIDLAQSSSTQSSPLNS